MKPHLISSLKAIIPISLLLIIMYCPCSMLYSDYNAIHTTGELQPRVFITQEKSEPHNGFLDSSLGEGQGGRALQTEDDDNVKNDVINVIGSTAISLNQTKDGTDGSDYKDFIIHWVKDTEALIVGEQSVQRIDISDYTSPKELNSLNVPLLNPTRDIILYITPDGQHLICWSHDKQTIYMKNLSQLETYTFVNVVNNKDYDFSNLNLAFCAGGKMGYIIPRAILDGMSLNIHTLYRFNVSSGDISEVKTIGKIRSISHITVSNDCNTIFLDIDISPYNHIPMFVTRIITDVLKDTPSTVDLKIGYAVPYSLILSHDENILFRFDNNQYLSIIDVSRPANPAIISKTSLPFFKTFWTTITLSPDDNTLVLTAYSRPAYILDISDLKNPIYLKSEMINYYQYYAFSPDSQYFFISSTNTFIVSTLLANIRPEKYGFSYVPLNFNLQQQSTYDNIIGLSLSRDNTAVLTCGLSYLGNISIANQTQQSLYYKDGANQEGLNLFEAAGFVYPFCQVATWERDATIFVINPNGIFIIDPFNISPTPLYENYLNLRPCIFKSDYSAIICSVLDSETCEHRNLQYHRFNNTSRGYKNLDF